MVYEGARSVYGPLLASLGASATIVGLVTGAGEATALLLRLVSGPFADRTRRYWALTIAGIRAHRSLRATAGRHTRPGRRRPDRRRRPDPGRTARQGDPESRQVRAARRRRRTRRHGSRPRRPQSPRPNRRVRRTPAGRRPRRIWRRWGLAAPRGPGRTRRGVDPAPDAPACPQPQPQPRRAGTLRCR